MRRVETMRIREGDWGVIFRLKNPLSLLLSFSCSCFAVVCPLPNLKNFALRLGGMKVGKNAFIAMGAAIEPFFPELVEIGDNAVIGYGCMVSAHELLPDRLRTGRVRIGRGVLLGAKSAVLPGVEIGDRAHVGAMSLVNCDVPPGEFYAGIPARKICRKSGD
jgi:acetyltransferase-like isoleucine patch superfamily enzyme